MGSALAQSWPALDVWVVGHGADPATALPAGLIADPRVHLLRHDGPPGAGAPRNLGAQHSDGDLLAFLDDDDVWAQDKTARQVAALAARDSRVAGIACAAHVRREGVPARIERPPPESELPLMLLREPCVAPSTVILRRAAFETVGGFDAALNRIEDWDLWARLSDRYSIAVLPEPLVWRETELLAADVSLRLRVQIEERLAARIERLPPRERARARAHHRFQRGVDLARLGERRAARRALRQAWREDSRSLRPLVHLLRTWTGEATWGVAWRGKERVRQAWESARRGTRPPRACR